MAIDAKDAADFYATRRGMIVARLIRERLMAAWPDLTGRALLGIGYPLPYLRLWRDDAYRCVALLPTQMGVARWPRGRPNLAALADEDSLPFEDMSFDRVLVIHGLEQADTSRRMLREVWRVLEPEGRLIVVAPNRTSPWAFLERTPFGHGQPYTPSQLGRLLNDCLFHVERHDSALVLPPMAGAMPRLARVAERVGRRTMPRMAGAIMVEAVKDIAGVVPRRAQRRRRLLAVPA